MDVNFSASFVCEQVLHLMERELEFNIWKHLSFVVTSFMLWSFGCKKLYIWRTSNFDTDGIPYIMAGTLAKASFGHVFSREFSDVIFVNIEKKKWSFMYHLCYFQRLCDKHIHWSMYKSTETSEKPPLADFPKEGTMNFQCSSRCSRKSWNHS